MSDPETEGAALADAAERGELRPTGPVVHGEQSRAEARALLMAATGATTLEDAARVALGRPRVGEYRPEPRLDDAPPPNDLLQPDDMPVIDTGHRGRAR